MPQASRIDGNTLSWVKSEIDQTMDNARKALESYVENSQDESQLRFCLNYLHQVYGTLQMVELYGAGMLANELERLSNALISNHVKNRDDAYEVMMRGMMQLPDYLERLQQGQADYPIILLPLLNDLRAARGAPLLSESALFSPNLEVDAPIPLESGEEPIDTLIRKLRHAYHLGLLDWFRDNDVKAGLKRIGTVIDRLRPAANDPDTGRVLWAASGLVEALQDDGLNSSVAVKLLMGQVDREFKKILDKGEFALSSEPPIELLKNLLYYVASSRSQGDRVSELKNAFALKDLMPDTETLERARADLSAPNEALMRTVSSVLLEDLTQVKDNLDVFVRAENRDPAALSGLCGKLSQMGDTLDMLGFGDQRMLLQDQVGILTAMSEGEREIDDAALMDVAGALLSIESALGGSGTKPAQSDAGKFAASEDSIIREFGDPEQRKLVKEVVQQVKLDLDAIKNAFNDYSRAHKHNDALQEVPDHLNRIRGSLSMLTLERASAIMEKAANYIQSEIISKAERPESHTLDLLADSISSVEYYLESLTESWGHPTAILDVAEQSLAALDVQSQPDPNDVSMELASDEDDEEEKTQIDLTAPEFQPDAGSPEAEGELTIELSSDATQPEIDISGMELDDDVPSADSDTGEISLELEGLPEADTPDTTPAVEDTEEIAADTDNDTDEISLELAGLPEAELPDMVSAVEDTEEMAADMTQIDMSESAAIPEPEVSPAPPVNSSSAGSAQPATESSSIADDLDDEIVEIFLEEADEEHGNISRLLPHWENNPQDEETLKTLRRSFHTLKGSGRLVGAADVGEFAWAFENMLNRVIDNSVQPDAAMFGLLERARKVLPDMFELFRSGQKPGQEIFKLMQQAEALSKGESIELEDAVSEETADAEQPESAEAISVTEDDMPSLELEGMDSLDNVDVGTPDELTIDPDLEGLEADQSGVSAELQGLDEVEQEISAQLETPMPTTVPNIDPVLLGIYRKEIATHLRAVREYVDGWRDDKDRTANHNLVRALHTLKGSSRTASVPQIAELCNFLEDHVKYLQDSHLSVDSELADLLSDAADFIEQTVEILDQVGEKLPDNAELVKRTRALLDKTRHNSPTMQMQMPESQSDVELEDIVLEKPEIEEVTDSEDADSVSSEGAADEAIDEAIAAPVPEYDEELLEIFIEEGVEILDESDHTLHDWIDSPEDGELVKALQRQLHTLKGGARMAGVTEIGDLSHSIENMLTAVVDNELEVSEDMFHALQKAQDKLVGMLEEIRQQQQPRPATDLIKVINAIASGEQVDSSDVEPSSSELAPLPDTEMEEISLELPSVEEELPSTADQGEGLSVELIEIPETDSPAVEPETESASDETGEVSTPAEAEIGTEHETDNVVPLEVKASQPPAAEKTTEKPELVEAQKSAQQRSRGEQIRVRSDLLDNLVNFAGEVSIYRSRMEQQTNAFRYNLTELDDTVSRLRGQLRQFEIEAEAQIQYRIEETGTASEDFDPLEFDRFTQMQTLSRGMLESLNDLDSLRGILSNLTRESETLLLQQSRVNTDLQEGLMRTRMVPISGQVPRMRRIVRQTSEELGKKVDLEIVGAENELDRTILERIMSPLEHMLRNAIAHGIEKPDIRSKSGKPETGTIQLNFSREGSDIVITVADDGNGINLNAIREKAVARGILKADAAVHKDDLIDIILESGFSTAEEVTQIAGRGVGMDVVNSEIKQLGGLLDIETEDGQGTRFTISMPMSLSVTRALMIRAGEETYAIPLLGVESVERVAREEILRMQNEHNGSYRWLENDYRYINLSEAMGLEESSSLTEEVKKVPVLLVRSGEHRAAIQVDGLIGSREIVVKPVGPQLSTLRGIAGATIMGDGGVVLILDLGVLIRLSSTEREEVFAEPDVAEPVVVEKHIPLVMVVDDSITVRKVTTRLLERNNFRTVSAKDGVDALAQLQEISPDVMLLDVEMPRMDGFELATNIRNDQLLNNLPIIMITSRTGQKHRDRAMSIGVNIYMGKPYSEGELLDNINTLLEQED